MSIRPLSILVVNDDRRELARYASLMRRMLVPEPAVATALTLTTALDVLIEADGQIDLLLLNDWLGPNDGADTSIPFLKRVGLKETTVLIVESEQVSIRRTAELRGAGATAVMASGAVSTAGFAHVLSDSALPQLQLQTAASLLQALQRDRDW